ncbi:MAG: HigA family addiction module antitoxin [Sandarakinorhabdus sp.]|nr:HigA family addiction module antitoxin [Sandarakinorhabdus sp.]
MSNPHPGFGLREVLLEPLGQSVDDVARATGLSGERIAAVLDGTEAIDADFDLRFGHYFGFSPGYFMRLQLQHDLAAARQSVGPALEAIKPLALQTAAE